MRIGEDARRSVVFFGVPTERKPIEYGGTGFLVSFPDGDFAFTYLATARHVAKELEKYEDTGFVLRVNAMAGESFPLPATQIPWRYHPDATVDLAVTNFSMEMNGVDQRFFLLSEDNVVDYKNPNDVMCGDIVNVVGLFRLHAGSKRNVPIVHTGNIAALPDERERVPVRDRTTGRLAESEVYLIEAQTLDGLSGSPAFAHEIWDLGIFPELRGSRPKAIGAVKLLGIYTGSWDGEPGKILEADRNLRGGTRVPVGMGMVVPAAKLVELIRDDPMLKADRERRATKIKLESAATQDAAIGAPPATDENPNHREDFMRLVGAAARKREPED